MRFGLRLLLCLGLLGSVVPVHALTSGTDIVVPAAGRVSSWVTDLYILNPGDGPVTVTVAWLVRNQANPSPVELTYSVGPGETLTLPDVIFNEFGLTEGNGAFRVTAAKAVTVNTRIYSTDGSQTFGQGFEGIPLGLATAAGARSDIVGLASNDAFRTNFYACAGGDGATLSLSLVDPQGSEIASSSKTLQPWMPYLKRIDQMMPTGDFDDGTLLVSVNNGSAVVGASKVDNLSTDPTTLSGSTSGGAANVDGVYQFAIYDSLNYSTGGNLLVEDGVVTALNGTYTNWDKVDGSGDPVCTWQFLFGRGLATPVTLGDLEGGVEFSDDHSTYDLGVMTYTVALEITDNLYVTGTIDAVGSTFPADTDGCNGTFPPLVVYGGKLPVE